MTPAWLRLNFRQSVEYKQEVRAEDWSALTPVLAHHGYRYRLRRDALRERKRYDDESDYEAKWSEEEKDRLLPSRWPTVQWGYHDQERVVFKALRNAKHPYEEKALSHLNQPSLRDHPDNLTVGLKKVLDVTVHGSHILLLIQPSGGKYWASHVCSSFHEQAQEMLQLFRYIVFLHEHYIAHLDVADRNVLYDSETKSLTFIDFELSVVRPTSLPSRLTVWHRTIPKMCQGEWPENTRSRKFDPYAADIWSLGNMLMNEVPEKQEDFPVPGFEALLVDMTGRDPRKRPKARQVLQRYQRLLCDMIFSYQLLLGCDTRVERSSSAGRT